MKTTLRVLIVDDQALVRTGLAMILRSEEGIEVVGEAADGREAIAVAGTSRPDVVLMDLRMAGMDGIAATHVLAGPDAVDPTKVLILTTFDDDELVYAALRAGASAFLLKDTPPEHLVHAIRVVADGQALLAPTVTRRLLDRFAVQPAADQADVAALDVLTARERECCI